MEEPVLVDADFVVGCWTLDILAATRADVRDRLRLGPLKETR